MTLQQAAQAVIDRWDRNEYTNAYLGVHITTLRKALEAEQAQAVKSNIEFLYEELRKATDGGSESMTHDDALKQIAHWRGKCSQVQAVEPVGVVDEGDDGLFVDLETSKGVVVKQGDKLFTHPTPPPAGERAELIARLQEAQVMMDYDPIEAHAAMGAAIDMLEADAKKLGDLELRVQLTASVDALLVAANLALKAQQVAVHPWLIRKEPHSKETYYVAEGTPPDDVLEIYGIKKDKV